MRRLEVMPLYDPPALPGFVVSTDVSDIRVVHPHCGCIVVAGAVRAKGRNDIRGNIFVDSNDKGKDNRARRMGCPTGVSRVNTRDMPKR